MMIKKDTKGVLQSGHIKLRLFVAKICQNLLSKRKQDFEIKHQWNSRNESLVECHYFGV